MVTIYTLGSTLMVDCFFKRVSRDSPGVLPGVNPSGVLFSPGVYNGVTDDESI